jgi:hypothetical protein
MILLGKLFIGQILNIKKRHYVPFFKVEIAFLISSLNFGSTSVDSFKTLNQNLIILIAFFFFISFVFKGLIMKKFSFIRQRKELKIILLMKC